LIAAVEAAIVFGGRLVPSLVTTLALQRVPIGITERRPGAARKMV